MAAVLECTFFLNSWQTSGQVPYRTDQTPVSQPSTQWYGWIGTCGHILSHLDCLANHIFAPWKISSNLFNLKKLGKLLQNFGSVSNVGNAVLLTALNAVYIILADLLSHCFMTWIL